MNDCIIFLKATIAMSLEVLSRTRLVCKILEMQQKQFSIHEKKKIGLFFFFVINRTLGHCLFLCLAHKSIDDMKVV